jgi:death-on-curing family protein
MQNPNFQNQIIIYKTPDKKVEVQVAFGKETIWLSQKQISDIFDTERTVVTKHIRNIFISGELQEKSNVQKMHIADSDKPVNFYSLDVIISVGYRVNSKKATEFRVWATNTLKNYLVKGYAVNEQRLLEAKEKFAELQETIAFLKEKAKNKLLSGQEQEILSLLADYSKTLTLLEEYDADRLKIPSGKKAVFVLNYESVKNIIIELKRELFAKKEAGDLFGQEYDGKLESVIKNLYQTFDSKELYKTVEEKAANLIYLVIKDHPLADGNKRTASFLFAYFLDRNDYLYKETGEKKINDNALTALALLIAVSDPKEKETMIKIIANLLKQ